MYYYYMIIIKLWFLNFIYVSKKLKAHSKAMQCMHLAKQNILINRAEILETHTHTY